MNVKKCMSGHYFDADKYQLCPHCGAAIEDEIAQAQQKNSPEEKKQKQPFWKKKEENQDVAYHYMPSKTIGKTFSLFDEVEKEPIKGTKVVKGSSRSVSAGSRASSSQNAESNKPSNDIGKRYMPENDFFEPKGGAKAQGDDNKYCPTCGKYSSGRAKFCKYCGNPLEEEKEPEYFTPADTSDKSSADEDAFFSGSAKDYSGFFSPAVTDAPEDSFAAERPDAAAPIPAESFESVHSAADDEAFENDEPVISRTLEEAVRSSVTGNDGKTIGFFSMGTSPNNDEPAAVDPVVGWLVCTKGKHLGESFVLSAGRNSVGRGVSNKVTLSKDNKVSRDKQVWITYEPKRRQFYVQPGESSGITYLNGEMITGSLLLNAKDKLELGDGEYLLIPLCDESFSWEDYIR